MIRLITHNFGTKLLSLAAAFGLWLNIASEQQLATIVSIPVQYANYPHGLEISSRIVDTIDVEARGTASQLRAIQESQGAAVLDFSGVKAPGTRTFSVTANELKLPRGVSVVRTIPAQLQFEFEPAVTAAVPVEVEFSGAPPRGFVLRGTKVEPATVNITGPASAVKAVTQAVTDPIDLTQIDGPTERSISLFVDGPEVRIVGAPRVKVKIQVEPRH